MHTHQQSRTVWCGGGTARGWRREQMLNAVSVACIQERWRSYCKNTRKWNTYVQNFNQKRLPSLTQASTNSTDAGIPTDLDWLIQTVFHISEHQANGWTSVSRPRCSACTDAIQSLLPQLLFGILLIIQHPSLYRQAHIKQTTWQRQCTLKGNCFWRSQSAPSLAFQRNDAFWFLPSFDRAPIVSEGDGCRGLEATSTGFNKQV